MDPSGAEALRLRLEQQRHWLQAPAVQDGRQRHADPDLVALVELRDNERVYRDEDGSFVKQLVGDEWVRTEVSERNRALVGLSASAAARL